MTPSITNMSAVARAAAVRWRGSASPFILASQSNVQLGSPLGAHAPSLQIISSGISLRSSPSSRSFATDGKPPPDSDGSNSSSSDSSSSGSGSSNTGSDSSSGENQNNSYRTRRPDDSEVDLRTEREKDLYRDLRRKTVRDSRHVSAPTKRTTWRDFKGVDFLDDGKGGKLSGMTAEDEDYKGAISDLRRIQERKRKADLRKERDEIMERATKLEMEGKGEGDANGGNSSLPLSIFDDGGVANVNNRDASLAETTKSRIKTALTEFGTDENGEVKTFQKVVQEAKDVMDENTGLPYHNNNSINDPMGKTGHWSQGQYAKGTQVSKRFDKKVNTYEADWQRGHFTHLNLHLNTRKSGKDETRKQRAPSQAQLGASIRGLEKGFRRKNDPTYTDDDDKTLKATPRTGGRPAILEPTLPHNWQPSQVLYPAHKEDIEILRKDDSKFVLPIEREGSVVLRLVKLSDAVSSPVYRTMANAQIGIRSTGDKYNILGFSLFISSLIASLGFWQLERMRWKKNIIELRQARMNMPKILVKSSPFPWANDIASYTHRVIDVRGVFDNSKQMCVGPRAATDVEGNSGAGCIIVTPLRLEDGSTLLVNRGFLGKKQMEEREPESPEWVRVRGILEIGEIPHGPRSALIPNNPNAGEFMWVVARDLAKRADAVNFTECSLALVSALDVLYEDDAAQDFDEKYQAEMEAANLLKLARQKREEKWIKQLGPDKGVAMMAEMDAKSMAGYSLGNAGAAQMKYKSSSDSQESTVYDESGSVKVGGNAARAIADTNMVISDAENRAMMMAQDKGGVVDVVDDQGGLSIKEEAARRRADAAARTAARMELLERIASKKEEQRVKQDREAVMRILGEKRAQEMGLEGSGNSGASTAEAAAAYGSNYASSSGSGADNADFEDSSNYASDENYNAEIGELAQQDEARRIAEINRNRGRKAGYDEVEEEQFAPSKWVGRDKKPEFFQKIDAMAAGHKRDRFTSESSQQAASVLIGNRFAQAGAVSFLSAEKKEELMKPRKRIRYMMKRKKDYLLFWADEHTNFNYAMQWFALAAVAAGMGICKFVHLYRWKWTKGMGAGR